MKKFSKLPYLGFGIGLRTEHYDDLIQNPPSQVQWLEIISEGFLLEGGRPLEYLELFSKKYPIIPHGVSLSIGSTDALDKNYLKTHYLEYSDLSNKKIGYFFRIYYF